MSKTREFIAKHTGNNYKYQSGPIPCMKMKSGLNMSVQVGEFMYCSPRSNVGPWHEVEVGFPSTKIDKIMDWAENPDNPEKTVYGYVPINLIDEIIEENGGLVE